MQRTIRISRIVALSIFLATPVWAQPAEPLVLTLDQAHRIALENNLDVQIERENPFIARTDIRSKESAFEPAFFTSVGGGNAIRPLEAAVEAAVIQDEATRRSVDFGVGLRQTIPTGGNYRLELSNSRVSGSVTSLDPSFTSRLTLTLTQPLLRGFGPAYNRAEIRIAKNSHQISLEAFEARIMGLLADLEEAYWQLSYERGNFKSKQKLYRAAEALLAANRAKVEQGVLPSIELLVAETGLASREEDLLLVEKSVRDAEDRLRQVMNLREPDFDEDLVIIPTQDPVLEPSGAELERSLERAVARRPDLRAERLRLENRRIVRDRTRHEALPALDFQGSAGFDGLGETIRDDYDALESRDFYSWQAALVLTVPMGNQAARSAAQRRQLELRQAEYSLERMDRQAAMEVREAVRRVETDFKRIGSVTKARILADKKLEAETERHRLGLASTQDLLEFQKDLADAEARELRAISDYNIALARLAKAEGTLLSTRSVRITEPAAEP